MLLSNLGPSLPSFSLNNWQSTIRHHVAVHPSYGHITRFVGRETSDIGYDDIDGLFTELLISKGHLPSYQWAGKTPRYYIEVKSTLDRPGQSLRHSPRLQLGKRVDGVEDICGPSGTA